MKSCVLKTWTNQTTFMKNYYLKVFSRCCDFMESVKCSLFVFKEIIHYLCIQTSKSYCISHIQEIMANHINESDILFSKKHKTMFNYLLMSHFENLLSSTMKGKMFKFFYEELWLCGHGLAYVRCVFGRFCVHCVRFGMGVGHRTG